MFIMQIYLDTCVYCRPFDDQTQERISKETKAFIELLELAEEGKISIIGSDVLIDEIEEIGYLDKHIEAKEFTDICKVNVPLSEDVIKLAKDLEKRCGLSGGDALNLASACFGAQHFLTCDDKILSKGGCIEDFARARDFDIEVKNPIEFVEERKWAQ